MNGIPALAIGIYTLLFIGGTAGIVYGFRRRENNQGRNYFLILLGVFALTCVAWGFLREAKPEYGADLAEPSAPGTASISCKASRRSRRTHILVISTSTAASLADTVGGLVAAWPARGGSVEFCDVHPVRRVGVAS